MSAELRWSADEVADACVKAGLGILECNSLMIAMKAAAPAQGALTDVEIELLWQAHTVPVFGRVGINPNVFARAIEQRIRGQVSDAADSARLDFVINRNATWYPDRAKDGAGILCYDQLGFASRREISAPTMREAIDAAIAAMQAQAVDAPKGDGNG